MKTLHLNFYQRYHILAPIIRLASAMQDKMDIELMYQLTYLYSRIRVGEEALKKIEYEPFSVGGQTGFKWDDKKAEDLMLTVSIEDSLAEWLLEKINFTNEVQDGKPVRRQWEYRPEVTDLYAELKNMAVLVPIEKDVLTKPSPKASRKK